MNEMKAKDLMVALDQYPTVDLSATLLDAVAALDKARRSMPPGRQPYQAVLVVDHNREVVGKVGQLALLRALEPQSHVVEDLGTLTRAGVSDQFLSMIMDHFQLFRQDLPTLCLSAGRIPVKNVMHPVAEQVSEETQIGEVIHKMVVFQTLSLLVTRDGRAVGLVRLSDLCDEVVRIMLNSAMVDGQGG